MSSFALAGETPSATSKVPSPFSVYPLRPAWGSNWLNAPTLGVMRAELEPKVMGTVALLPCRVSTVGKEVKLSEMVRPLTPVPAQRPGVHWLHVTTPDAFECRPKSRSDTLESAAVDIT